jgi:hypothetical protein
MGVRRTRLEVIQDECQTLDDGREADILKTE